MSRTPPARAELIHAVDDLIAAIGALGFERASDAIMTLADEPDPAGEDWHDPFLNGLRHALDIARLAAGEGDARARWAMISPEPGQTITWEWAQPASPEFAGVVLRSVSAALDEADPAPQHGAALRAALPVLRRTVHDHLDSCTIARDPATALRADWNNIAPDLAAIRLAENCIGPQPDIDGVDTDWLNRCLEHFEGAADA